MSSLSVNREEQLSQVLSVRLTEKQLQRLQKTLKNFGINNGSMSDQLRKFLKEAYFISLRRHRKQVETQVIIQKQNQIKEVDPEEEEAYEEWFNSLGSEL